MAVADSKYKRFARPWELKTPYCAVVTIEDLLTDYVVPFSKQAEDARMACKPKSKPKPREV